MDRPKDIYAPLAVQNWVEYADWLEGENEIWLETVAAHRAMLMEAEAKLEAAQVVREAAQVLIHDCNPHPTHKMLYESSPKAEHLYALQMALEKEKLILTGEVFVDGDVLAAAYPNESQTALEKTDEQT
jgi:hypothetical protein